MTVKLASGRAWNVAASLAVVVEVVRPGERARASVSAASGLTSVLRSNHRPSSLRVAVVVRERVVERERRGAGVPVSL